MKSKKNHFSAGICGIYICLIGWALTTIYPIFWIIMNAFKNKGEILSNSFALPLGDLFTTANFRTAFQRVNILGAYRNSLIISFSVAALVVLLAGMAAFALVRYRFRMQGFLMAMVVAGMMFPVFSTIIPVIGMLQKWGILNQRELWKSILATVLPQVAGNLSFAIVVLSGYIRSLPLDLEESAYLEGCGAWKTFFLIVVPVTKPSFATVAIFSFLWSYNDLFTQMFTLRLPQHWAITRLLKELTAMEGTNYGLMAASVALVVIPVIIVYIFLQKYIIKGMTAGALKG